jgi:carbonic anhydrase
MFVHRNIANQVHGADLSAQSVIAYAVDALGVQQILVTGHTACGGVRAATAEPHHGLVDHWLGSLRMLWLRYRDELSALPSDEARIDRLVRYNVLLQIYKLALNPTVRDAWRDGRPLVLNGLVYDIAVRVTPDGQGSRIDVRATSRTDDRDMGETATRVTELINEIALQLR